MKRFINLFLAVSAASAFTGSAWAGVVTPTPPAGYTGVQTDGELGGGTGVSQDGAGYESPAILANYYAGAGLPNFGPNPTDISGNVYGTMNVTGGTLGSNIISFTRIQDTGGASPLYLDGSNAGSANDSLWNSGAASSETLTLTAIIAADSETFGYQYVNSTNTALTGSPTNIFANGFEGEKSSTTIALNNASNFVWYDKPSNGDAFYSSDQYNTGATGVTSEDHEITYQITENGHGLNGAAASWLVCWEDTPFSQGSDQDYQDCIVEIDAYTVPVPASAWMGLVTLAGMGAVIALRHRAHTA